MIKLYDLFVGELGAHHQRVWMRFLWSLVQSLQPSVVVEIGTGPGASTRAIALGMREICEGTREGDGDNNPHYRGHLYSIDSSPHVEGVFKDLQKLGLEGWVTRVHSWSTEASQKFSKKIDLLVIDGGHDGESVKNDWKNWSKHLVNGAIVIFHDMCIIEVRKAFEEILLKGYKGLDFGNGFDNIGIIRYENSLVC